ncbi:MAG TPA: glucose-6-phosphate isomerase, partial [Myxococcota bacterium]|nr:glucose-6-phosphate isomerase [Myxococcota bacterium]
ANADEGRQVGHFWLRAPERAPTVEIATAIADVGDRARELARAVRRGEVTNGFGEPFTEALLVGIGGSALGPQLLVDALAEDVLGRRRGLAVRFLDNTDPDGVARELGRLGDDLRRTLVVVVSKSGSTPEPNNALALVRASLRALVGDDAGHLIAVTVEGSGLHALALREAWRAVLPMWEWVGGRFSWSSAVGLFPAELAGIDVAGLIAGARDMDDWTRVRAWRDNPAAVLAGGWYVVGGGRGERAMVMLPYADRLVLLSRYLQQLVMESVGKEHDRGGAVVHQGLTVYGNKGSTDQHAYVQQLRDGRDDFFAVFLQVLATDADDPVLPDGFRAGDHLQGFLLGTRRALAESGRRSMTLTITEVGAYTLGGLLALFERAVAVYASLIDVNAFHQPGVEAGKRAAKDVLALGARVMQALADGPATIGELAERLGADPTEILYLLSRKRQLGQVRHEGGGLDGTWRNG